jgi:hypothetical protein
MAGCMFNPVLITIMGVTLCCGARASHMHVAATNPELTAYR